MECKDIHTVLSQFINWYTISSMDFYWLQHVTKRNIVKVWLVITVRDWVDKFWARQVQVSQQFTIYQGGSLHSIIRHRALGYLLVLIIISLKDESGKICFTCTRISSRFTAISWNLWCVVRLNSAIFLVVDTLSNMKRGISTVDSSSFSARFWRSSTVRLSMRGKAALVTVTSTLLYSDGSSKSWDFIARPR